MVKITKSALWETVKFVVRMAILVVLPIAIAQVAKFTGDWKMVFDVILPIVLPVIDKWVHEDTRIPAKGLLPF